jgi:universal stress protein A
MALNVRKVLVPVDFSENSRRALRYGLQLASTLGASVTLLHVADPPRRGVEGFRSNSGDEESLTDYLLRQAASELDEFVVSCHLADSASVERRVRFGRPSDTIVETAEQDGVDLIVRGTNGGAGLTSLLLGSSAQRVIANAPCPVVAVKNLRDDAA